MGAGSRKQLGVGSAVAESVTMLFLPVALLLQILPAIAFLSPRQSDSGIGTIPTECAGNCTGPLMVLENCFSTENATCLCNQPIESAVFGCYLCLGNLSGNFSVGQEVINELASACDTFGVTLSSLAFPGQTFSGQTSTASAQPPPTSAPSNGLTGITIGSNGLNTAQTTMTLQGSSPVDTGSPRSTSGARPKSSSDQITAILWVIVPTLLTLTLSIVQ